VVDLGISVQRQDFDVLKEIKKLQGNRIDIGSLSSFIGIVRDVPLIIEHYPGMTENTLSNLRKYAIDRFKLLDARIIHRYGALEPGDQIVLVLATSNHRKPAIEAVDFMMDNLKTKAPFWKKEGESWVSQRIQDLNATKMWDQD